MRSADVGPMPPRLSLDGRHRRPCWAGPRLSLQFPENLRGEKEQQRKASEILLQWELQGGPHHGTIGDAAGAHAVGGAPAWLEQEADHAPTGQRVALDRRNRRTLRQLVLALLVQRSTRLLALGQTVAAQQPRVKCQGGSAGAGVLLEYSHST